ncbi:MAG TPA: hybrid sensor histidine kinase/response regulator [Vicinamibacterales bacterium]
MSQHEEPSTPVSNGSPGQTGIGDSTIRVDVGLLDRLMNLVGELVLARNQIIQFTSRREEAGLTSTSQRLNLITMQLQEAVMKTRMQPIGVVWNKLPRHVRDLATRLQKQITVEMDGADTELDKSIIEAIKDPLTHVVRNCCDHGIEMPAVRVQRGKPAEGRLLLRAFHEGGQVNIEITDDGAGVDLQHLKDRAVQKALLRPEQAERLSDREALDLLFLPGVSTADTVTSVSGRGVGMDVVKTNVERIGGVVDIMSRPGAGTTVKIKIPLTLAIIPGLVVGAGAEHFVIPQVSLRELLRLEGDGLRQLEVVHGTHVLRRRGTLLPIVRLRTLLALGDEGHRTDLVNVVVLQADGHEFGLVVDGVHDAQEIVVKPLDKRLKGMNVYAGATIMGDGRVALILDVHGIAELSGVLHTTPAQAQAEERRDLADASRQSYLVFRAGSFDRLAVPLALVTRLEEFPRNRVERAGGTLVVQYRGGLLRLVPVGCVLEGMPLDVAALPELVPAVVFSDGERSMGLIVDQIVDILHDAVTVRQSSTRLGLNGSAVVGKKVTDFLDLGTVLQEMQGDLPTWKSVGAARTTVVLADASAFSRALLKNSLELAGLRVTEAASVAEALEACERNPVDVLVAALDLPGGETSTLLHEVRTRERLAGLPVLGLTSRVADQTAGEIGFDGWVLRSDRDDLLRTITGVASRRSTAADAAERS